jgi:hypothetical protein
MLQPVNSFADWYWDCAAWTFVNLWFLPHQLPSMHGEADKWASQLCLNGIKSKSKKTL